MKKTIAFALVLLSILSFLGCGKEMSQEDVVVGGDLIPQVMVDGIIYIDMNTESTATDRAEGFDGEITSEVDSGQQPAENDQSNFGTGYGYQFGEAEGTLELYINGKWWIFTTEDVRYQMQFPERFLNLTEPPALIVTVGAESVEAQKGSMDWHSQVDDAMDSLISADSAQGAEGNVPVLRLTEDAGLEVSLFWEVTPDRVYLRYWSETDTDGEFVPVKTSNEAGDCYLTDLQDGNYSYEVLARWENAETYGGECCYQFRVEK